MNIVKLLPWYRPRQIIKTALVTNIAELRYLPDGLVEAVLVRPRAAQGIVGEHKEVIRLRWPLDALFEASAEFQMAKRVLMQQQQECVN
jgi:hypothetical protein